MGERTIFSGNSTVETGYPQAKNKIKTFLTSYTKFK